MISLCFGRQRKKERRDRIYFAAYQTFMWSNASSLLLVEVVVVAKQSVTLPILLVSAWNSQKKIRHRECCELVKFLYSSLPYLRRVYRSRPATMPPPPPSPAQAKI